METLLQSKRLQMAGAVVVAVLFVGAVALGVLYAMASSANATAKRNLGPDQAALSAAQAQVAKDTATLAADKSAGTWLATLTPGMTEYEQGLRDELEAFDAASNGNVAPLDAAFKEQGNGLVSVRKAIETGNVPGSQQGEAHAIDTAVINLATALGAAGDAQNNGSAAAQASTSAAYLAAVQAFDNALVAPIVQMAS